MQLQYLNSLLSSVQRRYAARWVINFLFVLSLAGAAYLVGTNTTPDEFFDYTIIFVLGGIALILFGISFFIERMVLTNSKIREILDSPADLYELTAHKRTGEVDKDLSEDLEKLTEDEINYYTIYHQSSRAMATTWILGNIIMILGLIVAPLTANFRIVIPFVVAALLVQLIHRKPNSTQLRARMQMAKSHS